MRYASKVDSTHAEIREALRECGFRVLDTSRYPGFVDMIARRHHATFFIEAKTPQNKAGRIDKTKRQSALEAAGFEIVYLRSREEALAWGVAHKEG